MYIYPDNLKSKATLYHRYRQFDLCLCALTTRLLCPYRADCRIRIPFHSYGRHQHSGLSALCGSLLSPPAAKLFLGDDQDNSESEVIMSMSRKKEKAAAQKKETTRQLIGINDISDYGLKTSRGMLAFFSVKPTNLSVQPPEAVGGRIYALMTVLKGQTEIEMLALNSKESFEDNKRYYRERAAMEELPVISRLLEADARSLDRLQVQMATAREFFVLIRFRDDQDADFRTQLSRVQKSLEDQGFKVRLAGKEDAKRMLGVYFEQNATTEKYEDFDGERWIVLND